MSELTKHDAIFLQVCDDDEDPWCGEVTWCQDRIHDEDVKYIRADLVEVLEAELEIERMRLVACGVVARANTRETAAEARQMNPDYRSEALEDVSWAVNREMKYREALAELRAEKELPKDGIPIWGNEPRMTREGELNLLVGVCVASMLALATLRWWLL